jgi:hypothetical protein
MFVSLVTLCFLASSLNANPLIGATCDERCVTWFQVISRMTDTRPPLRKDTRKTPTPLGTGSTKQHQVQRVFIWGWGNLGYGEAFLYLGNSFSET